MVFHDSIRGNVYLQSETCAIAAHEDSDGGSGPHRAQLDFTILMIRTRILPCAAAFIAAGAFFTPSAHAAVYQATYSGTGTYNYDWWGCPVLDEHKTCLVESTSFAWSGVLTIETADSGDGTYSSNPDPSIAGVTFANFTGDSGTGSNGYYFAMDPFLWSQQAPIWGQLSYLSVTISGGKLVGVYGSLGDLYSEYFNYKFDNLTSVTYESGMCHHCNGGHASGMMAAVPEPATWALMGLGLAAVGIGARRRRLG